MSPDPGARPLRSAAAAGAAQAGIDSRGAPVVGICTADAALVATLRDAGPELVVAAVDTPQALVDLIVGRGCFAVFLDVRGLGGVATLVPALARQFPALPIVAVGTRGEEAPVARLIGSGEVHRFLHVPVSLERARTFLGAARRRADELQLRAAARTAASGEDTDAERADEARADALPARTTASPPRVPAGPASDPARSGPVPSQFRATLFALTALGLAVAAGTAWMSRPGPAPVRAPASDPAVADLVGAADVAAAAGDLLAPAGRSAADYYRRALDRRPGDAEARASLLALADRMLGAGERALVSGRWAEAAAAADTVALVRPNDARVATLRARAASGRAAAEAAPVARDAAAPLPAPGNTDERAGYEEAREARPPEARSSDTAAATPLRAAGTASTSGLEATTPPSDPAAATSDAATVTAPEAAVDASAPPAGLAPNPPSRPPPLRRIEDAAVEYPPRARSRGIEGWVDVAFTVDATGSVTGARVLSAQPADTFDEAALAAVRRWRYAPPPAPQDANVRVRFQIDR